MNRDFFSLCSLYSFLTSTKPLCLSLISPPPHSLTRVLFHDFSLVVHKHASINYSHYVIFYVLCSLIIHNIQEAQAAAALQSSSSSSSTTDHPNSNQVVRNPSSPSTMAPQNYVQQLASALGFTNSSSNNNNNTNNNNNGTTTSNITSSTDFESLIEMNRRQQQMNNVSNI